MGPADALLLAGGVDRIRPARGFSHGRQGSRSAWPALAHGVFNQGRAGPAAPADHDRSLLRQVLEYKRVLGRDEVAERHLVKRKLPEEREHPVVIDRRSAWQADLFDFPAAGIAEGIADLLDQSLLGVVPEVRRDSKGAYRAHRHVLDPALLAYRFLRPFSRQDARIRDPPRRVDRLVHVREDLLLGVII